MHYLRFSPLALLVAFCASTAGCTWTNGAGPGGSVSSLRERAGTITESDIFRRLPRVLAEHGYFFETVQRRHRRILIATQWRPREPLADEQNRGAVAAETRIRFRAVRTDRFYRLHMEIENRTRTAEGPWQDGPVTPMFRDYAGALVDAVRFEITTGVRRY